MSLRLKELREFLADRMTLLHRVEHWSAGRRYQSRYGWFYIGLMGNLYALHLEMGRVVLTIARKRRKK